MSSTCSPGSRARARALLADDKTANELLDAYGREARLSLIAAALMGAEHLATGTGDKALARSIHLAFLEAAVLRGKARAHVRNVVANSRRRRLE